MQHYRSVATRLQALVTATQKLHNTQEAIIMLSNETEQSQPADAFDDVDPDDFIHDTETEEDDEDDYED